MTRFGVLWPLGVDPKVHARSIANTGCKEVRLMLDWGAVEQTEGTRNWAATDQLVTAIRGEGLGVLPIVYFSPKWHRPDRRNPPDPWKYAAFLVEVAARYHFPAYEIWNEPDNPWLLDWTGTKEEYADLYRVARYALHEYDHSLDAVLGGLTYIDPVGFLKPIWGRLGPVDAVGYHPYGFGQDPVADTYSKLKTLTNFLNSVGSSAPVDVTEIGMIVPPQSEKQRSAYLKELAHKIKSWKRIRRFCVFAWYAGGEMSGWSIAKADGNWKGGAMGYSLGIRS